MFDEFPNEKRYKILAVFSPSMRCQVGKKHLFFTYMVIMFFLMGVIPVQFVCGMPIFFCYNQNSFCHAFNLLCRGYNLFVYSNYSLCDIHYFQCCALNFLSVVHNSANTHCYFGNVVPPT